MKEEPREGVTMTRKKVKLAYIANESARKATFKKRRKGLVKKVSELSTLCEVKACAIIYGPYDAQPEVWATGGAGGVQEVLSKFKEMPEMEQSKKMVNQESFLKQRLAKARDQLKRQLKDNREKEITCLMYRSLTLASHHDAKPAAAAGEGGGGVSNNLFLQGLSMVDLNDLGWIIDQHLKDIQNRINVLTKDMINASAISTTTSHDNDHLRSLLLPHPPSLPHQFQATKFGASGGLPPPPPPSPPPPVLMKTKATAPESPQAAMVAKEEEEEEEMKRVLELIGDGGGGALGSFESSSSRGSIGNGTAGGPVEAPFMHSNHPWFMNLLNFGTADDVGDNPFADPYYSLWSTAFFP